MTRTILIHLNVETDEDERDYKEIVADVEGALEVGMSGGDLGDLSIEVTLAEEL